MTTAQKSRMLDFGFATALLLAAGFPLLYLRANPAFYRADSVAIFIVVLAGLVSLWAYLARRGSMAISPVDTVSLARPAAGGQWVWWPHLLVAILLGAITYFAFYRPLRIHFWMGADEFLNFQQHALLSWMFDFDIGMNRPFIVLPCAIGQMLTPGRIDGFLWIGAGLCWITSLLLFAILRELLSPQAWLLPTAAAVLLLVDRSEPTRFFVMFTSNYYWLALAFFLLGALLFLRSYRVGSRLVLALSCAALGASLLMFETAYPLAVLVPVLAWMNRAHRQRLLLWTWAWAGTLALFAIRFLLFLSSRRGDSYQEAQLQGVMKDPHLLLASLRMHLTAGLINFQVSGAAAISWELGVVVLALASAVVGFAAWRSADTQPRLRYALILALSALALLFGTLPYLPMPGIFRTQYFSGPGQATLLASAICLVGSLLGRRVGGVVVTVVVGLIAANATGETIATQKRDRTTSPAYFERTAHVFRQVHAVCPNPAPDTLFVLVPTVRASTPLGCNYPCLDMSPLILGAKMVQADVRDGVYGPPVFGNETITISLVGTSGPGSALGTYDKLVAFSVAPDGTVALLRQLPSWLVPPNSAAANRYDPLAVLRSGPVKELAYFRYPRWAQRPCDLFDMADGIVLGAGWGPLECRAGALSRRAADGAELVINSLGQKQRELHLHLAADDTGRLEAVDSAGKVVATADLAKGEEVRLTVPTDPAHVSLLSLRIAGEKQAACFRVLCPGGETTPYRPPVASPDIMADDLELGSNWHQVEFYRGEYFRWVDNDAEIVVKDSLAAGGVLQVVVEPGPGLDGQPGQLTIRDQAGQVLATGSLRGREEINVALPAGTPAETLFRLHIANGGHLCPSDLRIRNFRVLRCTLRTE